jgi:hypothetical protein
MFVALQIICILYTVAGVCLLRKEYKAKADCGYEFSEGDL